MKMRAAPPDVKPEEWYNTTDAAKKMGMTRTTFWRKAKAGFIKRKCRPIDGNFWYKGKDLTRAWNLLK